MKKSIIFIIPYFGEFRNYFQLFLNSCKFNNDITWLILTDDHTKYDYPKNVKVIYTTFEETKRVFQNKFDFEISLNRPYKICDFKPAYGYIYEEYIKGYDFWGYCDTDVIFGKIRDFYTEELLNKYDKLGFLGHCTIFRNDFKINRSFMSPINGKERYKEVFSDDKIFQFDEERNMSINTIFEDSNYKCNFQEFHADIYFRTSNFKLISYDLKNNEYVIEKNKKAFFIFNNGKLERYIINKEDIEKKEYLYIHIQKRNMNIKTGDLNYYKIIPNSFDNIARKDILEGNYKKIKIKHLNAHYIKLRSKEIKLGIKRRIKKYIKILDIKMYICNRKVRDSNK